MLTWSRSRNGETTLRYWQRFMGDDVAAISAQQQAARITIPVQLIHGRDDTVVPFEQSSILADSLRRRNKTVEMVVLDGEDHWLSSGRTRLQMLTAQVAFLERYNPPN
jgi:dipeptidyl aminopeptidase/acylaminoacyl peptidase